MRDTLTRRAVAVSLLLAVSAVPRASALVARVFLSGTGVDSGNCSDAANPCRSLQYAINQAAAGAEVVIVSSGGYGGATITKSITVNAPTGVVAFVGRTITVTIASTDTVTLRGLSMNGAVFGDQYGISFTAGGTLNVENTVISSFARFGVSDTAPGSELWVHNCDVKQNQTGIYIEGNFLSAVIENSRFVENPNTGVAAFGPNTVVIRNSVAERNGTGFSADGSVPATEMVVDSCMVTNNGVGLWAMQFVPGTVVSLRVAQTIVMNNGTNLLATWGTPGASNLISYGGNRIGGATGGTTGFTSTVAQQ